MEQRGWVRLFFVGLAVAALFFLAAGISGLHFSPGHPLPSRQEAEELAAGYGPPPRVQFLETLIVVLVALAQLLLPFAIVYFLLSPKARRSIFRMLGLLLWIIALFLLIRSRPELFTPFTEPAMEAPPPEIPAGEAGIEFDLVPPHWLVLATRLGLGLLVAGGLVFTGWFVWRQARRPKRHLRRLAQEAEKAIHALQTGAELRDVITRCYLEMSRTVREQQGLSRDMAMTTQEFAVYLEKAGLPGPPIRQLTHLFEQVRYGARSLGEPEERAALACLDAIVAACNDLL